MDFTVCKVYYNYEHSVTSTSPLLNKNTTHYIPCTLKCSIITLVSDIALFITDGTMSCPFRKTDFQSLKPTSKPHIYTSV